MIVYSSRLNDHLSSGTLWTTSVKSRIFAQRSCCSKKHGRRKSGENRKTGRKNLCKAAVHTHRGCGLWKTPVEKAVENVENYEFSTGIWLFQRRPGGCGKVCIPVCIKQVTNRLQKRYVTVPQPWPLSESGRKSWRIIKNGCQSLSPLLTAVNFFVKNRQKLSAYHFCCSGNTYVIPFITEERKCREK